MAIQKKAEACWEVERRSCGEAYRSYYVVLLKNKLDGKSVVKTTSSDAQSTTRYAEQMKEDLRELSDYDFATKYNLGPAA